VSKQIFKSTNVALLVAFLAFVSNGIFYHFTATRTEPIAFLFLMLALYYFVASYQKTSFKAFCFLQLSLICFFCAALNKAQILVLAPFYFCWAAYFIPSTNLAAKESPKKYAHRLIAIVSYASLLAFYSNQSAGLGFLFNIALLSFFNLLIAGIALKLRRSNQYLAITIFNACYLVAFQAVEFLSTHINLGISIFGNIADPMSMTRFLKSPESMLMANPSSAEGIANALNFMISPLVETFSKFTSPTLLILFCVGYLIYHRRIISQKEWWFAGFSVVSFYIVNLVNKIRYLDNPHYQLFSEFFLFTFALMLIYKMPQRVQKRSPNWR
jgi:hypothetical protein